MRLRTSQKALLSAIGAVLLITLMWLVTLNVIVRGAIADGRAAQPAAAAGETVNLADLTGFTRIRTRNGWDLTVTQGASWQVSVVYPDGMADRFDIEVRGDVLELNYRAPRGFRFLGMGGPGRGTAVITMPTVERVHMEGAGSLNLAGFEGERLELFGAGAYAFTAEDSRFTTLELSLTGAGAADLSGLTAVNANVTLTGATDTRLTMGGGALTGSITGAGQLEYAGTVREETLARAGAAVVRRSE